MVNEEKKAQLLAGLTNGVVEKGGAEELLASMTTDQILELKRVLDLVLPPRSLGDMNLEHELLTQYEAVKTMQESVLVDDSVPVNQRAQCANAVASTLQQLVKMQTDFYQAERFKALESLMIKAVKKMPKDIAAAFLEEYEEMGNE